MEGTFYDAPNDYRTILHRECLESGSNYLAHHGVKGMRWGVRKRYPIIGRPRTPGHAAISRNPLISSLQISNMRRNEAKERTRRSAIDKLNPKSKDRHKKAKDAYYNYIQNKVDSYGKDKKLTSKMNAWAKKRDAHYGNTNTQDALKENYKDDRSQRKYEMVKEYLFNNDPDFMELHKEWMSADDEMRKLYRR